MANEDEFIIDIETEIKKSQKQIAKLEKEFEDLGKEIAKSTDKGSVKADKSVEKFSASSIANIAKVAAGAYAVKKSFDLIVAGTAKIVQETGKLETATVKWEVLTGSVEVAEQKIKDIFEFSNSTPFTFKSVEQAASIMYNLTDGALQGENALRLLGDRAAKANQPIEEISVWFGRLYSNMQAGRPIGEAMARMQELGIVSGKLRNELEDMSKTDMMNGTAWQRFIEGTENADGMMERLSQTIEGKLSTLEGVWDGIFAFEDETIQDEIKSAIDVMINTLNDNKPMIQSAMSSMFTFTSNQISDIMKGWELYFRAFDPGKYYAIEFEKSVMGLTQQFQNYSEEQIKAVNSKLVKENLSLAKKMLATGGKGEDLFLAMEDVKLDELFDAMRGATEQQRKLMTEYINNRKTIEAGINALSKNTEAVIEETKEKSKDKTTVDTSLLGGSGSIDLALGNFLYGGLNSPLNGTTGGLSIGEQYGAEQMLVADEAIHLMEESFKNIEAETKDYYAFTETIITGSNNAILDIHEAFAKKSIAVFTQGMSSLAFTARDALSQLGNLGFGGDLFKVGSGLLGGLGIIGAGAGLISTIAGFFEGDKEDSASSSGSTTLTQSGRANIVNSGPETVNVNNSFVLNGCIVDEATLTELVDNEISPRLANSVKGALV